MMDISEQKKIVRKEILAIRKNMSFDEVHEKSTIIQNRVLSLEAWNEAETIYAYLDFRNEVETDLIINAAFRQGKRLALPRCIDRCGHMAFHEIRDMSQIMEGMYGIREPIPGLKEITVENGIMIVPGVAFDENRLRLGYGGGYYDRFLEKRETMTYIALAYAFQVKKSVPAEEHDQKADLLITEERWYD